MIRTATGLWPAGLGLLSIHFLVSTAHGNSVIYVCLQTILNISLKSGEINESHSIGGFDGVNPLEMSAAYAAFARGGTYIEPYSFTKI